jgi:hypothetical protein
VRHLITIDKHPELGCWLNLVEAQAAHPEFMGAFVSDPFLVAGDRIYALGQALRLKGSYVPQ